MFTLFLYTQSQKEVFSAATHNFLYKITLSLIQNFGKWEGAFIQIIIIIRLIININLWQRFIRAFNFNFIYLFYLYACVCVCVYTYVSEIEKKQEGIRDYLYYALIRRSFFVRSCSCQCKY